MSYYYTWIGKTWAIEGGCIHLTGSCPTYPQACHISHRAAPVETLGVKCLVKWHPMDCVQGEWRLYSCNFPHSVGVLATELTVSRRPIDFFFSFKPRPPSMPETNISQLWFKAQYSGCWAKSSLTSHPFSRQPPLLVILLVSFPFCPSTPTPFLQLLPYPITSPPWYSHYTPSGYSQSLWKAGGIPGITWGLLGWLDSKRNR